MAIDNDNNIYAQSTNAKRLKKKWVQENLTNEPIEECSVLARDMQTLYNTVVQQTKYTVWQFKTKANPEASYKNLKKVSKIQSSLKEFITH